MSFKDQQGRPHATIEEATAANVEWRRAEANSRALRESAEAAKQTAAAALESQRDIERASWEVAREARNQAASAAAAERHAEASRRAVEEKLQFDRDVAFLSVGSPRDRIEYFVEHHSQFNKLLELINTKPELSTHIDYKTIQSLVRTIDSKNKEKKSATSKRELFLSEFRAASEIGNNSIAGIAISSKNSTVFLLVLVAYVLTPVFTIDEKGLKRFGESILTFFGTSNKEFFGFVVFFGFVLIPPFLMFSAITAMFAARAKNKAQSDCIRIQEEISKADNAISDCDKSMNDAAKSLGDLLDRTRKSLASSSEFSKAIPEFYAESVNEYLKQYPPNCRSSHSEIRTAALDLSESLANKSLRVLFDRVAELAFAISRNISV